MRARRVNHDSTEQIYAPWKRRLEKLRSSLTIRERIQRLLRKRALELTVLFFVSMVLGFVYFVHRTEPLETASMQETTYYWGPRGLLLSPAFREAQTDPHRKVDIFVFKGTDWVDFTHSILRKEDFERPFVVVSAGSDFTIPREIFKEIKLQPKLPDKCLAWFSTNVDLHDFPEFEGRIKPLPIGLDFDGKTRMTHAFVEGFGWQSLLKPWSLVEFPVPPQVQEAEMLRLVATLPHTLERKLQVYADFWVNKGYGRAFPDYQKGLNATSIRRKEAYEKIKDNPNVAVSSYRLTRMEAWRAKGQYMFELSIPGNGMDCYRTWEALVLGIVVITVRSPLDPLFTGLPVVIVDDLEDITESNLMKWKHEYGYRFADPAVRARLTNQYWVDHVLAEVKKHSDNL